MSPGPYPDIHHSSAQNRSLSLEMQLDISCKGENGSETSVVGATACKRVRTQRPRKACLDTDICRSAVATQLYTREAARCLAQHSRCQDSKQGRGGKHRKRNEL